MIRLNIGGTKLQTCSDTLSTCRSLLEEISTTEGEVFLDRDPKIFTKLLKLLRGYPVHRKYIIDSDVLRELIHWDHEMLDIDLPENYHPVPLTVYTLDQQQTESYGKTHTLVQKAGMCHMMDYGFLAPENYLECVVVGAPVDWNDCNWIPNELINLAVIRYKFAKYFCQDEDLNNFSVFKK
jgi:hypothetical protein